MDYKKYTIIILCILYGCLLSVALINIVVDPFYIFRTPILKTQAQINDRTPKSRFKKTERKIQLLYFGELKDIFYTSRYG